MEPIRTLFAIVRDAMRCVETSLDQAVAPVGIDAVDFEISTRNGDGRSFHWRDRCVRSER